MTPDKPQPTDVVQWNSAVTFRSRAVVLPSAAESLNQNIDEDICYSCEDRREARNETLTPKTTRQEYGVATRKPHVKRPVRDRKLPKFLPSKHAVRKQERLDESRPVVRYRVDPAWLLEPDGDEPNPLLPSPFSNDLIKRYMHKVPTMLAGLVSKTALGAHYGRSFADNLTASLSQHPAQLHAMMLTAMHHDRISKGIPEPTTMELMVGTEAIRHLNKEISNSNPEQALSDSNIWAVLSLAYSGSLDKVRSGQEYPRQSFLRELQSIHIYLKMDAVVEHVLGLFKMIEILGDLRKIKTPGMAQIISWAGVMGSVRNVTRPIFPFISHTSTFVQQDGRLAVTSQEREAAANDLGQLGTGFKLLWALNASTSLAYLDSLLEVIQDICDFTLVVENHASGRWVPRTSPEIIDQRNFVQHKLMSLRSQQELVDDGIPMEMVDLQYETCRLACIVYSFIVVFPVPPVVGPFETLTERLKRMVQATGWTLFDRPRLSLHLWVLVMGAIASLGLPDRPWYLLRIMEILDEFDMRNWKDLRTLLKAFLWHPRTSDSDGLNVWKAVQQVDTIKLAS